MTNNCLNCSTKIIEDYVYCPKCGQKTSTHRFSLKGFLTHDFVHGVFHLDKGILYTIKELFTRPGHSIREFIQGKRVKHFNYISLLLVSFAIISFLEYFEIKTMEANVLKQEAIIDKFNKIYLVGSVILIALPIYFLFRKSKQNLVEKIVIGCFMGSAFVIMNMFFQSIPKMFITNTQTLILINKIRLLFLIGYIFTFLYQYYSNFYLKKIELIVRCSIATFLMVFIGSNFYVLFQKLALFLDKLHF